MGPRVAQARNSRSSSAGERIEELAAQAEASRQSSSATWMMCVSGDG